jgi:hypothetical protein
MTPQIREFAGSGYPDSKYLPASELISTRRINPASRRKLMLFSD